MKYRPHRGSLQAAMTDCVELVPTMAALRSHISAADDWILPESLEVAVLMDRPDDRIGWVRTCVVTGTWVDGGHGPIGFTDELPELEPGP